MEQRVHCTRCFFCQKWTPCWSSRSRIIGLRDVVQLMRYKPKSIAALHVALGGLPDKIAGRGGPRHPTVSKDCRRTSEDDRVAQNLAVTTPQQRDPNSAVKVSKANVATCTAPKS